MEIGSLSPSPQGVEGTDRGVLGNYIDLKYRVKLRI
jgi:hypothetical protein